MSRTTNADLRYFTVMVLAIIDCCILSVRQRFVGTKEKSTEKRVLTIGFVIECGLVVYVG